MVVPLAMFTAYAFFSRLEEINKNITAGRISVHVLVPTESR